MALTNGFKFEDEPEQTTGVYAKIIGMVIKNNKMTPGDSSQFENGIRADIDLGIWKSKEHYDAGIPFSSTKEFTIAFPKDGVSMNVISGSDDTFTFLNECLSRAYLVIKSLNEFSEFDDA